MPLPYTSKLGVGTSIARCWKQGSAQPHPCECHNFALGSQLQVSRQTYYIYYIYVDMITKYEFTSPFLCCQEYNYYNIYIYLTTQAHPWIFLKWVDFRIYLHPSCAGIPSSPWHSTSVGWKGFGIVWKVPEKHLIQNQSVAQHSNDLFFSHSLSVQRKPDTTDSHPPKNSAAMTSLFQQSCVSKIWCSTDRNFDTSIHGTLVKQRI